MEQEADKNDSVYPPSMHVEKKDSTSSEGKPIPPTTSSSTKNQTKHAQTESKDKATDKT